jgi:peptidoglycan/xylan/chitin deacetylase (PgdA/CDA1 family)
VATVIAITDRGEWGSNTDNIVVADAAKRQLTWVPRDLWCDPIGNRINRAFALGGHQCLLRMLGEQGLDVRHSVCLRREAVEGVLSGARVTVPVEEPMDFWYPVEPHGRIEDERKRVSFRPPAESLSGERIHQWLGARRRVDADPDDPPSDLERIARQQSFVSCLLSDGFDFSAAIADRGLVSVSGPAALGELARVHSGWRLETLDDVVSVMAFGKSVLVRRGSKPPSRGRAIPILAYDRIGDPAPASRRPERYVSVGDLSRQLRALAERGHRAVTLRAAYDHWRFGTSIGPRPLIVSFDGGHRSVHEHAAPALAALAWPGVLNLTVGMLEDPDGVDDAMVRELMEAGWEVDSRSLTGRDLTECDDDVLAREVAGAKRWLHERLGAEAEFLCYPSGRYDSRVVSAAAAAGHHGATTTRPGLAVPADRFAMRRIPVPRGEWPTWAGFE